MPRYEYINKIVQQPLFVDNFMKAFFASQGIKPYLPLKSEIVKGIKQPNYEGDFKLWNYAMPYDIESAHLKQYRDEIRSIPLGFIWTDSELKEYNRLPNDELKRKMILDKVDMKSIYLPNLKYEKDFIDYPSLPTDIKSKDNFEKGINLYSKNDDNSIEAAVPYLESSAAAGNYIAKEILCKYYLKILESCSTMEDIIWERANKNFMTHCQWLQKANLPAGYYFMGKYHKHYIKINKDNLNKNDKQVIYTERVYPSMIKALELGSYDLMWELAVNNRDMEWALAVMLLTGESKIIKGMVNTLNDRIGIPITPRNMATMKLAVMLGSHTSLEIFIGRGDAKNTFLFSRNAMSSFFYQDPVPEYNYTLLGTSSKIITTIDYCEKHLLEKSFIIPEIDKCIPKSTVLFSPYANIEALFSRIDDEYDELIQETGYYDYDNPKEFPNEKILSIYKSFPYKDPRSPYSTIEHKKLYREALEENDSDNALDDNDIYDPDEKEFAKERIEKLIERSENNTISDYIYEYFGYANALKKRELEMNPHYYKLARPYIFPEEVYKHNPTWY